ncbi:hypothetical protein K431DRAFT_349941 [Polychaeton citri CBS 116435]|uniref:SMP domain-containing protein n=1 Tax=Polychaeton citri CBS 116435 TaxID=1314669 RepID=A0A9P4Q053_9PEZI|nr:hypothetical protein K431DRAFT_349941 [Polychaeton citri CBS 116435]
MSGSSETFNLTKEDIRKAESKESHAHGGNVPKGSDSAALQSIIDSADKSKAQIIEERKANLPLPEQPPVASDFNSADASTVNIGSDRTDGSLSHNSEALREPATEGVGREAVESLDGLPNDAVARGSKDKPDLADTTGPDYGYPQKNDPANKKDL